MSWEIHGVSVVQGIFHDCTTAKKISVQSRNFLVDKLPIVECHKVFNLIGLIISSNKKGTFLPQVTCSILLHQSFQFQKDFYMSLSGISMILYSAFICGLISVFHRNGSPMHSCYEFFFPIFSQQSK